MQNIVKIVFELNVSTAIVVVLCSINVPVEVINYKFSFINDLVKMYYRRCTALFFNSKVIRGGIPWCILC